jgi:hypothetical protein
MPRHLARAAAVPVALFSTVISGNALAQHESPSGESAHPAVHGHYENAVGIFLGFATEDVGSRENGLALGLEYERRLNSKFGIGGIVEHTYGDLDVWVYGLSFAYHTGPWRLYVAPGIEDTDRGDERLLRFGVEYGFAVGKWEIAPQLDIDLVDREAEVFVFGLTFARGFDF